VNQSIAVAYSKADIQRMAEPTVALARRSARNRSIAVLIAGAVLALLSFHRGWTSTATTPPWLALVESFVIFVIFVMVPAAVVRQYAIRNLVRLPALIKHGAVVPARLTEARKIGNKQRVGVTWEEGGKPAKGHIDVPDLVLGYVQRDTSALVDASKYVAVVFNERVFVGER